MSEITSTVDLTAADKETAEIHRALSSGEIGIDEANSRQAQVGEAVTRLLSPAYAEFAAQMATTAITVQQIDTPPSTIEVQVQNR